MLTVPLNRDVIPIDQFHWSEVKDAAQYVLKHAEKSADFARSILADIDAGNFHHTFFDYLKRLEDADEPGIQWNYPGVAALYQALDDYYIDEDEYFGTRRFGEGYFYGWTEEDDDDDDDATEVATQGADVSDNA